MKKVLFLLISISVFSCTDDPGQKLPGNTNKLPVAVVSGQTTIVFTFNVDQNTYDYTTYGEPPQIAVWLENPDSNQIRTVWVSNRSGKNQWKGKVECPVALPYWESRHLNEKSEFQERNLLERLIDAVTGATPTGGPFSTSIQVAENSHWNYFIEVNASGDYNKYFPYWSNNGLPDPEGNGQPSIVYNGTITATSDAKSAPQLTGRTKQHEPVDTLLTDLEGIISARNLLNEIQVRVK